MTKYDRRKVDDDENKRILDLSSFNFEPPEVGIYDEPVRWYKANLQWAKIIDGLVSWLATTAVWPDAENENYFAIQQILIFLQGVEPMTIDYEAWAEAFGIQMYKVVNDVAKQIVSGRTTDFVVGEDGTVSDPVSGSEDLPADDPDTPDINEELEAKAGGAIFLTNKLDKILLDMFTWYASGTITSQQAEDRLVLIYGFSPASANVFANYWYTVYMNSSGSVDLSDTILDGLFFCKGISISTLARYIFENHPATAELPVLEVFTENLTQAQLESWFQEGLSVPSKAYETYSCTKIDPEQVILDMSTAEIVQVTTAGIWKQNHRFRVLVSGTFTDADNPDIVRDFFWEHNTATGVKTFRNTNPFISSATNGAHTAAEVPFEASHNYNVIVEKTGNTGACIISCDNIPFNLPNTIGSITLDIEDLGEFVP